MPKARVIYWFRTDLRLHDSPALQAALDLEPECLWPIWCWDPHYVYRVRNGHNRWKFLLECQEDLSSSITKLNKKSKLFVIREAPQTLFPKLFKAWKPTHLVFEKDTDPYGRERDAEIVKLAKQAKVEVIIKYGRTLWDSDELVKANGNKPTMSISQVQNAGSKLGDPPRPLPAPKHLPDPGSTELKFDFEQPTHDPDVNHTQRHSAEKSFAKIAGSKGTFEVPTMDELGLPAATKKLPGGETEALKLLAKIIADEDYTATFEKPKTAPTAFDPAATTMLSPYHHFGALSVREFYWRVHDVNENYKGKASSPPVNLIGQLQFRDMYFAAHASIGAVFGQTHGNSHCRFIPWHLRSKIDATTGLATGEYIVDTSDAADTDAESWFKRWKFGTTGFPWIDAVMRQLRSEGFIHHLARHAVACFLTRGGCYISWERGAEVFEEWLLDHEPACNIGNRQWLSCTAFFAQFYRCYSPVAFPQKTDKNGDFVRRFVPELKDFPAKYIYEPWKAPIADQRKAGCLIKGDGTLGVVDGLPTYPKPMFDFAERREICLRGMKEAYQIGLNGADERVLDGSWRALFDDAAEGPTEGSDEKDVEKSARVGKEWELDDGDIHFGDEDGDDGGADGGKDSAAAATKQKGDGAKAERPASKRKRQESTGSGTAKAAGAMDKFVSRKSKK